MTFPDLVQQTIQQYVNLQTTKHKRPQNHLFYAYQTFVEDMLANALQDPVYNIPLTQYFLKYLLCHWTEVIPHYSEGMFTTPLKPYITGELAFDSILRANSSDIKAEDVLQSLRVQLNANAARDKSGQIIPPHENKTYTPEQYFRLTPFMRLVDAQLSFSFKPFQKMHWCMFAGSGGGKSSLIAGVMLDFLSEPDPPAMVIIDPHGVLAAKLERLEYWRDNSDRLLILDPSETPGINLLQASVSSIEYIFAEQGTKLTGHQDIAFAYILKALNHKPNANCSDLAHITSDERHKEYQPYIDKLDEDSRSWFRSFFSKGDQTRKGIYDRVHGLLHDDEMKAILNAGTNKVDLFDALHNKKKTVLITRKGLKKGMQQTWLKLMVNLCEGVARERERRELENDHPIQVFIDEAQIVLHNGEQTQAFCGELRKWGMFIRSFTQQISFLRPDVFDPLMGQSDIVITAAPATQDISRLADLMYVDEAFIRRPKYEDHFEYCVYDKNKQRTIELRLNGPPQDQAAKMSASEHQHMRELLCRRLWAPPIETPQATPSQDPPPSPEHDPTKPRTRKK